MRGELLEPGQDLVAERGYTKENYDRDGRNQDAVFDDVLAMVGFEKPREAPSCHDPAPLTNLQRKLPIRATPPRAARE